MSDDTAPVSESPESPDSVVDLLCRAADDLDVPPISAVVVDDVARGRRRRSIVRRRRIGLGVAAALVVAGSGTALALASGPDRGASEPVVATDPSTPAAPSPTAPSPSPTTDPTPDPPPLDGKQLLARDRAIIAEHLDPSGTHLDTHLSNLQSGGGLGTKLGWHVPGESGEGMVEFYLAKSWPAQDQWFCGDADFVCHDETFGHGADAVTARVTDAHGSTGVGVQRDDGSVVTLMVDDLFGNNSIVPVSGTGLTVEQLARAAADPRILIPSREQIDGASKAFGYPDLAGHRLKRSVTVK